MYLLSPAEGAPNSEDWAGKRVSIVNHQLGPRRSYFRSVFLQQLEVNVTLFHPKSLMVDNINYTLLHLFVFSFGFTHSCSMVTFEFTVVHSYIFQQMSWFFFSAKIWLCWFCFCFLNLVWLSINFPFNYRMNRVHCCVLLLLLSIIDTRLVLHCFKKFDEDQTP